MNGHAARCVNCGRPVEGGTVVCALCIAAWRSEHPNAFTAVFYDRKGRPVLDIGEAMDLLAANRRVADDWLELGGERVRVLTSHLVVEHGYDSNGEPILFETVVMGGVDHHWVVRYPSEEAARAGHAIVLAIYASGHTLSEGDQ